MKQQRLSCHYARKYNKSWLRIKEAFFLNVVCRVSKQVDPKKNLLYSGERSLACVLLGRLAFARPGATEKEKVQKIICLGINYFQGCG